MIQHTQIAPTIYSVRFASRLNVRITISRTSTHIFLNSKLCVFFVATILHCRNYFMKRNCRAGHIVFAYYKTYTARERIVAAAFVVEDAQLASSTGRQAVSICTPSVLLCRAEWMCDITPLWASWGWWAPRANWAIYIWMTTDVCAQSLGPPREASACNLLTGCLFAKFSTTSHHPNRPVAIVDVRVAFNRFIFITWPLLYTVNRVQTII